MAKLLLKTQWIGSSANAVNGCQEIDVDGFQDVDLLLGPAQERRVELAVPSRLVAAMIAADGAAIAVECDGQGLLLAAGGSDLWLPEDGPQPFWLPAFTVRNSGPKPAVLRIRLAHQLAE